MERSGTPTDLGGIQHAGSALCPRGTRRCVSFHFISHTHTLRRIQTCAMDAIKDAGQAVASQGTLWHESIKRDTFFQAPRPPATIPQDSWAYPRTRERRSASSFVLHPLT